jgi:hypothetical protein
VTDGVDAHHYFRAPKRYSTFPVPPGHPLEGSFRPDYPLAAGTIFLFNRIGEKISKSEILREEPDAVVVSVTYELAEQDHCPFSSSPLTIWIDTRTNLVSRMEGEMTVRIPMDREPRTTKHLFVYAHAFVNQLIPPQTFEFVPPADGIDDSRAHRRSGSGSSYGGVEEKKRFETWHSTAWEDETFLDRLELKIRTLDLTFERRLTFEGADLQISEKVTGPKGVTEREFSIPVSE